MRIFEAIKGFFHPTSSRRFKAIEDSIHNCYKPDIADLRKDRNAINHLMLATRAKRMKILGDLQTELNIRETYGTEVQDLSGRRATYLDSTSRFSTLNPDVEPLSRKQENLLRRYLHYVETTRRLKAHLDEVNEDLENFEYMVKSQAVAEITTYRGFDDWGESMFGYMSKYATGLGGLSIAGAGLVYSTIFNLNMARHNVGLMSLTFPLFTVGFLIPGFVYIAICWARNLPRSLTFASQRFWTAAFVLALAIATVMVIGAIIIVNVTILRINDNRKTWSLARISGIISLIFSGSVIAVAILALLIACFSRRTRTAVKDHWSRMISKERDALNSYNHV